MLRLHCLPQDEYEKTTGLLRFHPPDGSTLNIHEASARIVKVLSGLPRVHIRRLFRRGTEIYVDAVFTLTGYQFIRDRFKTEKDVGTPLLAPRLENSANDQLGGLEAAKRRRQIYKQ